MKFDKPTTEAILKDIEDEVPYKYAAESNGVGYHTLLTWINLGKKDLAAGVSSHYAQFLKALRNIEKNRIKMHTKNIKSEKKGHKGSEWMLERAFWQSFSSKAVEIDLNDRIEALENNKVNENVKKENDCKEE